MIPKRGVSSIDVEGKPFHDAEADAALFTALEANLASNVKFVEMDTDINDEAFAERAAELLIVSIFASPLKSISVMCQPVGWAKARQRRAHASRRAMGYSPNRAGSSRISPPQSIGSSPRSTNL